MAQDRRRSLIDTSIPHSARVWNYWLGGKDNYQVDRAAGDAFLAVYPGIRDIARTSRRWLARVGHYLAGEAGVRQFIDIGTGLPTANNTHEIVQAIVPDARVVYVDNDPMVLTHARSLLKSAAGGTTSYLEADLHDPETILSHAATILDFAEPVAVMLIGICGHVQLVEECHTVIDRLLESLPSGSYLALYDGTDTDDVYLAATEDYNRRGGVPYILRSPQQIAGFFAGLEEVEPGIVEISTWRPDIDEGAGSLPVPAWGGVGRKT